MMTKDVSNTGKTPGADPLALPPGPAPAKSTKPEREFSSVMEQATSRKAAHTRTTRSASRGRAAESESTPVRDRMVRSESNPRPVSRSAKSSTKTAAADVEETRPTAKAVASDAKNAGQTAPAEETASAEESAEAPTDSSEENASASETPTNIIPFPGQMPPTAVIIPFPLLEAQSIPAGGAAQAAPDSQATATTATVAQASGDVDPENVIVPLPNARAVTTSRALPEGERREDDSEGIDVEQLGLRPVASRETLEPATALAEPAGSAPETAAAPGNLESKIISVAFRPALTPTVQEREVKVSAEGSQLPGESAQRVETAPSGVLSESSAKIVLLRTDAAKSATDGASTAPGVVSAQPSEITGTSAARQDVRMESTTTSKREDLTAEQGDEVLVRLPELASATEPERTSATIPVRGLAENDWATSRLMNEVSRADSTTSEVKPTDSTGSVERISNLIVREAALVKKHGSDSMAVVLRPDAETELFVHLSQSNGQIEATIRCERGDAHQLGALWTQLQESLAQQKIRLAPLQETSGGNSNFNQPSGGSMTSGGQNGTREEARPEKQSMDEWPAPAVPVPPAPHVRGTGGSRRRRATTSRPGWETWA